MMMEFALVELSTEQLLGIKLEVK